MSYMTCGVTGCVNPIANHTTFCVQCERRPQRADPNKSLMKKHVEMSCAALEGAFPTCVKISYLGQGHPKILKKKGSLTNAFFEVVRHKHFATHLLSITGAHTVGEIEFTASDAYIAAACVIREYYPRTNGYVNPADGSPYPYTTWKAMVRQAFKILSCSSREAVYVANKLRPTYIDMCMGKLKPAFYCKKLHDENIERAYTGSRKGLNTNYSWRFVTRSTPLKYITPCPLETAIGNLGVRKAGRRGKCKYTSLMILT